MGAESGAVGRGIRLYGFALVEEAAVVDFAEQPPEGFDVAVVVGDVRVVHIHPVAHALGEVLPLGGVFHHLAAAGAVVFLDGDLGTDVGLGDAELLFHSELHWKTVSIPARAAAHLVTCHGLVAAHRVFDGTGHHVMDARTAVCTGGTFKEYELGRSLTKLHALGEGAVLFPFGKHPCASLHQIKTFIFFETHNFSLNLYSRFNPQI